MISTLQEFADAIAVERQMLEWASPRPQASVPSGEIDLREPGNVKIAASGNTRRDHAAPARDELRPLLFLAGWKVLDLMIEYAFDVLAKPNQKKWSIVEKASHARAFDGSLAGLSGQPDVWQRLCLVYDATVEARHAVVHRRLELDGRQAFINLAGAHSTITTEEQNALQGLALHASYAVLRQGLRLRDQLRLSNYLNALRSLHARPALPSSSEAQWTVIINSPAHAGRWQFDAQAVLTQAERAAPNSSHFDVEIHLVGSGRPTPITGALEEAAQAGVTSFAQNATEPWMNP